MNYDADKALEMAQSISAIFDHAGASTPEACSAIALSIRVKLDNEPDKMVRSIVLLTLIKHLTMDTPKPIPIIDLLKPHNGS